MRAIRILVMLMLVSGLAVFSFYKTHDLIFGSAISIDSPKNGSTLSSASVVIKGRAPDSTLLTINGAKVLTDARGGFEWELILGVGYNLIRLESLDHFNRPSSRSLELVYRPSEDATSSVAFNRY